MREAERARLRQIVFEFTAAGRDPGSLPLHKQGIVARLRELGRDLEASSIESGAGFSLVIAEGGQVEIISGRSQGAALAAGRPAVRLLCRIPGGVSRAVQDIGRGRVGR